MEQDQIPTPGTTLKRGVKAQIIRQCLAEGWSNQMIVDHVLAKYPAESRKNVQTLVWRYRQYLTARFGHEQKAP